NEIDAIDNDEDQGIFACMGKCELSVSPCGHKTFEQWYPRGVQEPEWRAIILVEPIVADQPFIGLVSAGMAISVKIKIDAGMTMSRSNKYEAGLKGCDFVIRDQRWWHYMNAFFRHCHTLNHIVLDNIHPILTNTYGFSAVVITPDQHYTYLSLGIKSAKWPFWWLVSTVPATSIDHYLWGLQFADGNQGTYCINGSGSIFTACIRFHDELIRLLIHASRSVIFSLNDEEGTQHGVIRGSSSKLGGNATSNVDYWCVRYVRDLQWCSKPLVIARDGSSWVEPTPDQRVWSIKLPGDRDRYVVTRRVEKRRADGANAGKVESASRPILVKALSHDSEVEPAESNAARSRACVRWNGNSYGDSNLQLTVHKDATGTITNAGISLLTTPRHPLCQPPKPAPLPGTPTAVEQSGDAAIPAVLLGARPDEFKTALTLAFNSAGANQRVWIAGWEEPPTKPLALATGSAMGTGSVVGPEDATSNKLYLCKKMV
ncbi:hypothetical protein GGF32_006350, partial [Allomyces javanicus]